MYCSKLFDLVQPRNSRAQIFFESARRSDRLFMFSAVKVSERAREQENESSTCFPCKKNRIK